MAMVSSSLRGSLYDFEVTLERKLIGEAELFGVGSIERLRA